MQTHVQTTMQALVKKRSRARALARGSARSQDRHQRRPDPGPPDRDLRHRRPHLQVGRLGAEDDPVPMVVGHEFVGEIVEVGSNVTDFQPGEIVSGEGHVVCGRCRNCLAGRRHLCKATKGIGVNRPGAFAEYLSLPMTNVWVHDPAIPRDVQSIFDPFGNAVHTALQFDVLGEDVLITGAGPIGIMAAAVVRHAGARYVVITDVNPYRLELARKMGVTLAVNPRETSLPLCRKSWA